MGQDVLLVSQMICILARNNRLVTLLISFCIITYFAGFLCLSGTENYLCTDMDDVLLTAKVLYSCKPPPFYTDDFKRAVMQKY